MTKGGERFLTWFMIFRGEISVFSVEFDEFDGKFKILTCFELDGSKLWKINVDPPSPFLKYPLK
jgi:hypothetical protein